MEQRDRLHTGELHFPNDSGIMEEQLKFLDKLYDFNRTRPSELDRREELLRQVGEHDRIYYYKDRKIDYDTLWISL